MPKFPPIKIDVEEIAQAVWTLMPTPPVIEGEIELTGEEDTIIEDTTDTPRTLEGYIDLSNMQDGDIITITLWIKMTETGEWKPHATKPFYNAQSIPILHILTKPTKHGIKITAKQTQGTLRTLKYQFIKKKII